MFIFLFSVIIVSFISLCFFKSKFWENRYLILLITGGVALVATLATNFAVRGHLQTKIEVISTRPLYTFYMPDSLLKDSLKTPFLKGYNFFEKHNAYEYFKSEVIMVGKGTVKDSLRADSLSKLHKQRPITILIYTEKKGDKTIYLGTFRKKYKQDYDDLDGIYIAQSPDSTAYRCRKKLIYDVPKSNWLTNFSLPRIKTIEVIYVPASEYKTIPDSLIRKIPF